MSHEACPWCQAPDGNVVFSLQVLQGPDDEPTYAIWGRCSKCRSRWHTWPRPTSSNEPTT